MTGGDLTFEQIEIALNNMGISLKCGGCASLFYTGFSEEHDSNCSIKLPKEVISYCPCCMGELKKKSDTGEGTKHCSECNRGFFILITSGG